MNGISNKVSLTEGNIQNIDDENVTVAVSTDVPKELDKVEKDDKQSYEEFKILYKDVITMKCKQDFGDCEDQKLWEDAAKELFLQSKNYILDGEEFKSKENLQEEPEKEKKTENVMVTPQVIKENNENEFDNIKPGDEFINDSGSKIVMLEPTETDEYNFKIINTNTNEEGTGKFSCTFMRDLLKDNHYKKVESSELDESINNEPKNELNATEFVSLIDNLKKMDLWDGKDETFKDAVEKYYSILDTQSKLKNEGTILSEEQLKEEADSPEFKYQLLDRLKSDCEYFLKAGNRNEKHLWAGNVDDQIAKMKELWNSLEEKPEWLSMEDIENYEKEMKQDTVEESKIEEIKTTSENTENYDAIDYFWQDEDVKTIQELIGEAANVSIDEKDKAVLNIKAPQTKYINGGIINGSDILIDAITEYVHKQYPEVEIKVINSGTTFILQDKVTWKSKKDITEESKMKELENNYKQQVDEDNKIEESYRVHWTYIDKKDNKHSASKGHFLTIEEAQAFVNELKKKPISQQGPVDEPEIKTESKSLEEGAKEDLGIEPGSDEEAKLNELQDRNFKEEFNVMSEKDKEKYKELIPVNKAGLSSKQCKELAAKYNLDADMLYWVANIGEFNLNESKAKYNMYYEEVEDTLTESVNIGDKVRILNSNELHNNKQGEVTYIDDDIITVKLDNGRSFNYDKNQVQKIEEGVKEKTTLEEDKFFNLYQSFNNLYGINKMNPSELIEFINDLKKMNRISDKDFNVMNDYANKWQDLINKTGYESNIVDESKEVKTEDQYEAERRKGRPNLDKIAKEVFEYDDYYINVVDNYKDEWDFVKDNVAEVAAEYNLREQAAEAVMRKIYKMAKVEYFKNEYSKDFKAWKEANPQKSDEEIVDILKAKQYNGEL